MKGIFISFEGIEGTGKTTQSGLLSEYLRTKGLKVVQTAEPGGTSIGEKIRELLLAVENRGMDCVAELLLYNASRVQHITEIITPALERGEMVLTDRFSDSTVAYQGYGRGVDLELIDSIDLISTRRLRPDITFLLDIDVETGLARNRNLEKNDRIELESVSFHQKVREGFLKIASENPGRIKLIDCSAGIDNVHREITDIIDEYTGR